MSFPDSNISLQGLGKNTSLLTNDTSRKTGSASIKQMSGVLKQDEDKQERILFPEQTQTHQ